MGSCIAVALLLCSQLYNDVWWHHYEQRTGHTLRPCFYPRFYGNWFITVDWVTVFALSHAYYDQWHTKVRCAGNWQPFTTDVQAVYSPYACKAQLNFLFFWGWLMSTSYDAWWQVPVSTFETMWINQEVYYNYRCDIAGMADQSISTK